MILYLLLAALAFGNETGADRCQVKECTCKVQRSPSKGSSSGRLVITFDEDSARLTSEAKESLIQFARTHKEKLSVTGFADTCGDPRHNAELSRRRAETVKTFLAGRGIRKFIISYQGESQSSEHSKHDRKVVVSTVGNLITDSLFPADAYIIDASQSIQPYWKEIAGYNYPSNSKIYLSKMYDCYDGQRLNQVRPSGGTEVIYTMYSVIQRLDFGDTLVVVSDFQHNRGKSYYADSVISKMIQDKRLDVYYIKY